MKKLYILAFFSSVIMNFVNAQNVGISTTTPQANLDVNGTFILGANGTAIHAIIRDTVIFDPGPVVGVSTQSFYIPFANVLDGATAYASCYLPYPVIVSSCFAVNDFVVVRLTNVSGSLSDPPTTTFWITVIQ